MTTTTVGSRRVSAERPLSQEKSRFCEIYALNGNNGADAVQHAFKRWAQKDSQSRSVKAYKLLSDRRVQDRLLALQKRNGQLADQIYDVNAKVVIRELVRIGFSNFADWISIDDRGMLVPNLSLMTRDHSAAIASIEVVQTEVLPPAHFRSSKASEQPLAIRFELRVKLHDKVSALVALGQTCGLWTSPKQQAPRHTAKAGRLRAAKRSNQSGRLDNHNC